MRSSPPASSSSRNGEPSTTLWKQSTTGISVERESVPSSTRRSASRRTAVFIVLAACIVVVAFLFTVTPVREVLHDDSERRLPLGGERVEDLPERGGLRRRQAGGARRAGEGGEAPGVAEARAPAARSPQGRLLRRRDAVLRRLDDLAAAGPEADVVDLLRRPEEDEVARGEILDADRDELRVAEAHLRAVPEEEDPVPLEDAPDEAGAVEAPGRRPAPGVGGAEEAAGHREPGGRVEDRRSLARPLGGDVVARRRTRSARREGGPRAIRASRPRASAGRRAGRRSARS